VCCSSGELGGDSDAPSELVSERTGTVFVIEDKSLKDKSLEELQMELGDGVLACEKGLWGKVVVRVNGETTALATRLLNEPAYPLHRKDRKVYPMYNLRPYGSRGWPTFERSASSIVLAHLTQCRQRGGALSDKLKQAEASGPKLINIDVIDALHVVEVAHSRRSSFSVSARSCCAIPSGSFSPGAPTGSRLSSCSPTLRTRSRSSLIRSAPSN
jgi:hypothetical protein